MKKALIYFIAATAISFVINQFLLGLDNVWLNLYYALAFGMAWGLAYYIDRPDWNIAKKLGISLIGVAALVIIGLLFFTVEEAVPSIIRFSTLFVVYYLLASFKNSKSLRK